MKFWPMERGHIVTDTFGYQAWRGGVHYGLDLGWPGGSGNKPIFAVQGGTVINTSPASGFGRWILIDHPTEDGGGTTVYGHIIPEVNVGQRVEAGQRIGRINPDQNTNGGVAPHLHIEWHKYVWSSAESGLRLDPAIMLQGAAFPGEAPVADKKPDVPAPAVPEATLWGIDVSNHQKEFDFAAAKREGFAFATHKITEGDFYRDPYWPRALDQMREHFPGAFGGYHFWRKNSNPERQADLLLLHIGDPSVPIQLDFEDTDQPRNSVTRGDLDAILKAISDRGLRVFTDYLPRWYWEGWMNSCDMSGAPVIWNSDYGNHRSGYASNIYPGNHDAAWRNFGSHPVAILQFSEKGWVAGLNNIDVNAFRGNQDELRALFAGQSKAGEITVSEADRIIRELKEYIGPVVSDLKDVRFELTGSRDNPNYPGGIEEYPGHPSLYDLRAGKPEVFHGTITRFIQELDAKAEALTVTERTMLEVLKTMVTEIRELREEIKQRKVV